MAQLGRAEYKAQLQQCLTLAEFVSVLDVRPADVLETMNRAEAVGPILNPTLYQAAATPFQRQKAIIEAVLDFQQAVTKIADNAEHV